MLHFLATALVVAFLHLGFLKLLQWDPKYVEQLRSSSIRALAITAVIYGLVVAGVIALVGLVIP